MKKKIIQEIREESVLEMLDKQYLETDNKDELDYWTPLSKIILESIELRDSKGMSQTDLAKVMKTCQSVISRFENIGRLPSYDFIARLALALGHSPGMTLYGDYMAVVPIEKQNIIKEMADKENISTKKLVQTILDQSMDLKINIGDEPLKRDANTTFEIISDFDNTCDYLVEYNDGKVNKQTSQNLTLAVTTPYQDNILSIAS